MAQQEENNASHFPKFYITPLESAIKAQDYSLVRTLVESGADVNHINRKGLSPLHIAVALKDTAIVSLLATNGADLEARTLFFETALLVAADVEGNVDMVYHLLRLGANILARDDEGNSVKGLLTEKQYAICVGICAAIKNDTV